MTTRREFLRKASVASVVFGVRPSWIQKEEATFPDYPKIPKTLLSRLGWGRTDRWQVEKEDAKWSISTYEWHWLRQFVREKSDGVVDIPLGGLIAFHIGNNEKTWRVNGSTIKRGNEFALPSKAKWDLDGPITQTYKSFLDRVSKQGFKTVGSLDWSFDPVFPSSVGILSNKCMPSGTLTTEQSGSVQLTQFNLEYPIKNQTANSHREVNLKDEANLDFFGWLAGWSHNKQIYAVGAVHPRATRDYCGYDNPHLEEALSKVHNDDVNLDMEQPLYGKVHSLMGAIE